VSLIMPRCRVELDGRGCSLHELQCSIKIKKVGNDTKHHLKQTKTSINIWMLTFLYIPADFQQRLAQFLPEINC
jgi:hypothetical protein